MNTESMKSKAGHTIHENEIQSEIHKNCHEGDDGSWMNDWNCLKILSQGHVYNLRRINSPCDIVVLFCVMNFFRIRRVRIRVRNSHDRSSREIQRADWDAQNEWRHKGNLEPISRKLWIIRSLVCTYVCLCWWERYFSTIKMTTHYCMRTYGIQNICGSPSDDSKNVGIGLSHCICVCMCACIFVRVCVCDDCVLARSIKKKTFRTRRPVQRLCTEMTKNSRICTCYETSA